MQRIFTLLCLLLAASASADLSFLSTPQEGLLHEDGPAPYQVLNFKIKAHQKVGYSNTILRLAEIHICKVDSISGGATSANFTFKGYSFFDNQAISATEVKLVQNQQFTYIIPNSKVEIQNVSDYDVSFKCHTTIQDLRY